MNEHVIKKEEYHFKDGNRSAVAHFSVVDFDHRRGFVRCDYVGVKGVYDLDDWKFINEISSRILEIEGRVDKEKYYKTSFDYTLGGEDK